MSRWHYDDRGQQIGPITLDELRAKVKAGELTRSSLVWQVGTKDWAEVQSFPELVELIQTPPPLPRSVITPSTGTAGAVFVDALPPLGISIFVVGIFLAIVIPHAKDSFGLITIAGVIGIGIAIALVMFFRPKQVQAPPIYAWRRFFAKVLDVEIAALLGLIAATIVMPDSVRGYVTVFLGISLGFSFLLEVPFKCRSPGRYFFGVRVSQATGVDLAPNFFLRFMKLAIFGMGLGIPVISAIAGCFAYKRLRETGTTKWDEGLFTITYRNGVGLPLIGVIVLFVLAGMKVGIDFWVQSKIDRTIDAEVSAPSHVIRPSGPPPSPPYSASNSQADVAPNDFWAAVNSRVPDWPAIDRDPQWIRFLNSKPSFAERTYRELITVEIQGGNAEKIANLVETWRSTGNSVKYPSQDEVTVSPKRFWSEVIARVPDWKEIDKDPRWIAFLDTSPTYTNTTYRDLIAECIAKRHPQKVANLVEVWLTQVRNHTK